MVILRRLSVDELELYDSFKGLFNKITKQYHQSHSDLSDLVSEGLQRIEYEDGFTVHVTKVLGVTFDVYAELEQDDDGNLYHHFKFALEVS
jgi:hypothetical protein